MAISEINSKIIKIKALIVKMARATSLSSRILPPLAFIAALVLLVAFSYNQGLTGLPPTEKRYISAKARITQLKEDARKNSQREPWENLAREFRLIYDSDPSWPNRPAALFKEAESLEELSRRSFSRSDTRKAIAAYENVALKHASSKLADDALIRAARLRAAGLKDNKGALSLLKRLKHQYPKGDMYQEACALEKIITASDKGQVSREILDASNQASSVKTKAVPLKENSASTARNFSGDLPLAYKAAVSKISVLKKDSQRSCWRQPWEQLRNEFLRINKSATRLAAGALFYAAICQQNLAACSKLATDAKKAIELFEAVAAKYPAHAYADDALFNAALIKHDQKKLKMDAVATLDRLLTSFPNGDMRSRASQLKKEWEASGSSTSAVTIPEPVVRRSGQKGELQILSWSSPNTDKVEIVLELSTPAKFDAKMLSSGKNRPSCLQVELKETDIIKDIRKGVTVNGSLLQAIKVKSQKNGASVLQFDLRKKSEFITRTEVNPPRIIFSLNAQGKKNRAASEQKYPTHQVSNLASQLGLTVHRIFIDAGHGGNDPGASHNKILERNITLDIAMNLGRLLKNNGFEVVYSREKNRSVPLSKRTEQANAQKADLFVSIHVNANSSPAISGFETYYLNLASNQRSSEVAMLENASSDKRMADLQKLLADLMLNARINESKRLAGDIQKLSLARVKKKSYEIKDNGVKSAPFHVLLGTQMPAVLVEVGYCTNKQEAKNLANPLYRQSVAEGIAEGIMAYRDRLHKNRTAGTRLTDKVPGAM